MKKNRLFIYFLPSFVASMYLFLYIPVVLLIIFSFNKSPFAHQWTGFTFGWYYALFQSVEIWEALKNSLIVACSSVFLSIIMGGFLVFYGMNRYLGRLIVLFYGNLVAPEIIIAVGLLGFFSFFWVQLGITTLIAAHTLIGLGYVVPILYTRFSELDYQLIEVSLDLGASKVQTFFNIVLPQLFPAIIAASLLVFIVSLDDFIIAFFCAGATSQTLPLYIFSMIKTGSSPIINALSSVLLCVSSILVLLFSSLRIRKTDILK